MIFFRSEKERLSDGFGDFARVRYDLDGDNDFWVSAEQLIKGELELELVDVEETNTWFSKKVKCRFNVIARGDDERELVETLTINENQLSRLIGMFDSYAGFVNTGGGCSGALTQFIYEMTFGDGTAFQMTPNHATVKKAEQKLTEMRFG